MKALIIVGIGICISSCHLGSQPHLGNASKTQELLSHATPEEVGMSSEIVKEAEELFIEAADKQKVLGYQIVVARRGKVFMDIAGGVRDLEKNLPMERNSQLRMASITKSVTAAGILILADRGLLSLDDPVSKHLAGFENDPSNKITIRHLLLHQSGIINFATFVGDITQNSPETPNAPSLEYEAYKIGQEGPVNEPGTSFRYNNRGYNTLAAIIENVSQQKLPDFMAENIFTPLGMDQTSYKLWGLDSTRIAKQYWYMNDQWDELEPWEVEFPRGSSSIISDAGDFAKFGQMLLNEGSLGEHRILKKQTVLEATSPIIEVDAAYLPLAIEKDMGFKSEWYEYRDQRDLGLDLNRGYGFVISTEGAFSHAGIYGTFLYVDPSRELVFAIFAQSIYGGNPGQAFIETINRAIVN
jgi:CubicO group peptidase (beta-lactamase class C family)